MVPGKMKFEKSCSFARISRHLKREKHNQIKDEEDFKEKLRRREIKLG